MPQKQLEHPQFRFPGPGRLSIYDSTAAMYQQGPMIENVELRKAMTNIESREVRSGVFQTVERRLIDESYSISFRFMENLNPDVIALIMGDGTVPTMGDASVKNIQELIRFYGTYTKRLRYPHDIVSSLPPPTDATGTPFGTGGSIAADDWIFAVVAGYKEGEDNPHSTPAETTAVTVAEGEKVAVEWSAPAGITPDHYTVYMYQDGTETIADGRNCGQTSGISMIVTNDDGAQDYETPNTNLTTVKSYDGVTTYVVTTDYTIDTTKGTLKRVSGGGIDSAEKVQVSYYVNEAPNADILLGPGLHKPQYVKLMITCFSEDDDGKDAGLEIELYKVDPRSGSSNLPFTDEDYFAGSDQEWPCLVDLSEDAFGKIKGYHKELANFVKGDFDYQGGV